jgi:hypothetical protein
MALLNSGFIIDDPSEIAETMQQILRTELGLEPNGEFEELEVDLEDEEEETEGIEAEIPNDDDDVGEQVEEEEEREEKEDL